ncbi:Mbov_0398 family ICE element protein [Mycoplasmopsis gallinacea]|uniref:Mbov_0398 family ICE element protein n=1 Tax=Mycoplasmopsis gallinacea TaxID=29556 RepID=UPI0035313AD4
MFYAFRKSIFASLSPFHSNIKHWFNLQNIEIEIINKKLDLVLNLLAKSGNLNLHSPKEEFLNELDHFKIVRKNETIELMLNKKKEDEKIKETVKTFERFQKVAFDTEEDVANKISKLEQGESDGI